MFQVATEPVTKTIEGCVLAATLAEGGITRAMKVMHVMTHDSCDAHDPHDACDSRDAHDAGGPRD